MNTSHRNEYILSVNYVLFKRALWSHILQVLSSSWDERPQCRLGRGLPPYQVASLSIQPLGHNRHEPKIRGAGSPYNIMSPGPRSTSLPSGILIHPAGHNKHGLKVWGCAPLGEWELSPYLTQCGQCWGLPACQVSSWSVQPFGWTSQPGSQTDRTGQRCDGIGRTILQTFAQKLPELWPEVSAMLYEYDKKYD